MHNSPESRTKFQTPKLINATITLVALGLLSFSSHPNFIQPTLAKEATTKIQKDPIDRIAPNLDKALSRGKDWDEVANIWLNSNIDKSKVYVRVKKADVKELSKIMRSTKITLDSIKLKSPDRSKNREKFIKSLRTALAGKSEFAGINNVLTGIMFGDKGKVTYEKPGNLLNQIVFAAIPLVMVAGLGYLGFKNRKKIGPVLSKITTFASGFISDKFKQTKPQNEEKAVRGLLDEDGIPIDDLDDFDWAYEQTEQPKKQIPKPLSQMGAATRIGIESNASSILDIIKKGKNINLEQTIFTSNNFQNPNGLYSLYLIFLELNNQIQFEHNGVNKVFTEVYFGNQGKIQKITFCLQNHYYDNSSKLKLNTDKYELLFAHINGRYEFILKGPNFETIYELLARPVTIANTNGISTTLGPKKPEKVEDQIITDLKRLIHQFSTPDLKNRTNKLNAVVQFFQKNQLDNEKNVKIKSVIKFARELASTRCCKDGYELRGVNYLNKSPDYFAEEIYTTKIRQPNQTKFQDASLYATAALLDVILALDANLEFRR